MLEAQPTYSLVVRVLSAIRAENDDFVAFHDFPRSQLASACAC